MKGLGAHRARGWRSEQEWMDNYCHIPMSSHEEARCCIVLFNVPIPNPSSKIMANENCSCKD